MLSTSRYPLCCARRNGQAADVKCELCGLGLGSNFQVLIIA